MYQIQAEWTLDQVVQARVEGKVNRLGLGRIAIEIRPEFVRIAIKKPATVVAGSMASRHGLALLVLT